MSLLSCCNTLSWEYVPLNTFLSWHTYVNISRKHSFPSFTIKRFKLSLSPPFPHRFQRQQRSSKNCFSFCLSYLSQTWERHSCFLKPKQEDGELWQRSALMGANLGCCLTSSENSKPIDLKKTSKNNAIKLVFLYKTHNL